MILNERVDALFENYTKKGSPGCAVALLKDGETLHQKGYGLANVEHDAPITPTTLFNIGSESKQFTAFAVLLLAAAGKLALDDDIRLHLAEAPDFGQPVTIRRLLYHTSGVRCSFPPLLMLGGWLEGDLTTNDDVFRLFLNQRALNFAPGTEYAYANMGYVVLAQLVARVAGTPFAAFCRERIFAPLGMANTVIQDSPFRLIGGRAQSYWQDEDGAFLNAPLADGVCGPTNVYTSVADLALWDENFYTGRVGGPDLIRQMQEPGTLDDGTPLDYACGLMAGPDHRYRGLRLVEHGGGHGGYVSALVRLPELHLSAVTLFNVFHFGARGAALSVLDAYLDDNPALLADQAVEKASTAARETITLDEAALDAKAGLFFDARRVALREFTVAEGKLHLGPSPLAPVDDDVFVFEESPDARAVFTPGTDGRAAAVQIVSSTTAYHYNRVLPATLGRAELEALVGLYTCPELNIYWEVVLDEDGLRVRHQRYQDSRLTPLFADAYRDDWSGTAGYPAAYTWLIDRDEIGTVIGFRVSDDRMRHLRFVRVSN